MIVAMHCHLCQRLAHGEFKRRARKPRNADPALQRHLVQRPDERQYLVVAYCEVLQSEWCEVVGLAEGEVTRSVADRPDPGALSQVDMMEAREQNAIRERGRKRLERPPVFAVRPRVMCPHVPQYV